MSKKSTSQNLFYNLLLVFGSLLVGVFILEYGLRTFYPFETFGAGTELPWMRKATNKFFKPDDAIGFRPAIGNSWYDKNGIVRKRYNPEDLDQPYKILFMGDSVTARGRIIKALSLRLKNNSIDYLNGGVESFNIEQEVGFYFRYQYKTKPDHIIHTLHINDFTSTPIAFRGNDGLFNVYSLKFKKSNMNIWLFKNSHIYRFIIAYTLRRKDDSDLHKETLVAIQKMQNHAKEAGIRYDVVIFPLLSLYDNWSAWDKNAHESFISILKNLKIDYVDLLPISQMMIKTNINAKENKGDSWHPNDRFAEFAADYIIVKLPRIGPRHQEVDR